MSKENYNLSVDDTLKWLNRMKEAPINITVHAFEGTIDSCIEHITAYRKMLIDVVAGNDMQTEMDELIESWWDDFTPDDKLSAHLALDVLKQFSLKHRKEVIDETA